MTRRLYIRKKKTPKKPDVANMKQDVMTEKLRDTL